MLPWPAKQQAPVKPFSGETRNAAPESARSRLALGPRPQLPPQATPSWTFYVYPLREKPPLLPPERPEMWLRRRLPPSQVASSNAYVWQRPEKLRELR